ncbi:MAG: hypothetical protein QW404_02530 [Candidatus Nanoarchaeia archaeon]
MKIFKIILPIILILSLIASAHQPRIVYNKDATPDRPIIIKDPEISRAFYGELDGNEDNYMIISEKPSKLYLNILTPYNLMENRKDFFVEVRDFENDRVTFLDGTQGEWKLYYEKFGRDYYMMGPELRRELEEGIYYMNVSSNDNTGKYTLAVGEIESFPPGEILKTFISVPKIKMQFFGKPWYKAFTNTVGISMLIVLLGIIALIVFILRVRKMTKRKPNSPKQLTS